MSWRFRSLCLLLLFWTGFLALPARAQGILTVTPGAITASAAGTGTLGYSGDSGAAASATLATPSALAYDTSGNLFVADTANHVIREIVKSSGKIVTVAGSGVAGYAGDGGPATDALLDTPTSIAIDASGNLYLADSHNHRIRKVTGGVISTIAGTGIAGFAGDGGPAAAALLASPHGITLDATGNVYLADTDNNRIRKIVGGVIRTIAGTGEQSFTGDGGAATAAALDSPASVAIDTAGNVYLADRHNQRIRVINGNGIISTVAGSGTPTFSGGYSGDGANSAAATLSRPTGVSVDAAGNIYIADTDNQRIRTITAGTITTAAGNGVQHFAGDGGVLTSASFNSPRSVAVDAAGDLSIADTGNLRIRSANDATITFAASPVGVSTASQSVTLSNTGTATLTVSSVALSGPFATVVGTTCSALPISLAPGASCTELLAFTPVNPGVATGSISFAGPGAAPQTVLLSGTGAQGSSAITLVSSASEPFVNQNLAYTATVTTAGSLAPTGTVSFYANGALIGTAQTLTNGTATVTTTFPAAGTVIITAVYSGDANFAGVTSSPLAQLVADFSFTITADPTQSGAETVVPGQPVSYKLTVAPLAGPFTFPITLSATGLPPGATATFTPSTITLGSTSVPFTMTIQTSATASLPSPSFRTFAKGAPVLALLLLPFTAALRRRLSGMRPLMLVALAMLSLGALLGLAGCGANSGFFGTAQQSYTINVIGTANNGQGATLQRVASVKLTLQ